MKEDKPKQAGEGGILLVLENSHHISVLLEVQTSTPKKREKTKEEIRVSLSDYAKNVLFNDLRAKPLDIAILIYVNNLRMKRQDVDNVAKVVLDALRKQGKSPEYQWLIEDDCHIRRLLVYKKKQEKSKYHNTHQLVISFR